MVMKKTIRSMVTWIPMQLNKCAEKRKRLWLLSVLIPLMIFPATAMACTSTFGDWIGMNKVQTSSGAQANISDYNPRMCNSVSAWSAFENSGDWTEFAQVGWLKAAAWSTNNVYYFYEYGGNLPVQIGIDTNAGNYGGSNQYTVYTNANNVTEFIINGVGYANATLNWTPTNDVWSGEIHTLEDQIPGDLNHIVYFNNVQHLYNGTWYNDIGTSGEFNNTTYGSGNWSSSSNWFTIWDTRYSTES